MKANFLQMLFLLLAMCNVGLSLDSQGIIATGDAPYPLAVDVLAETSQGKLEFKKEMQVGERISLPKMQRAEMRVLAPCNDNYLKDNYLFYPQNISENHIKEIKNSGVIFAEASLNGYLIMISFLAVLLLVWHEKDNICGKAH